MNVEVFSDTTWASSIAGRLREWVRSHETGRLCLPTGSTVEPVYAMLSPEDLGDVSLFLLDEFGGLPAGDPARCSSMLETALGVTRSDYVVPDVDHPDPVTAAAEYGSLIRQGGGIDLAVVGLGRNGHIGMNEPGSGPETETRRVDLHTATSETALGYGASTAPTWGITIGLRELLEASEIWLLVSGGHKREMLKAALHGPTSDDVPATHLRSHKGLTVFADQSAAG